MNRKLTKSQLIYRLSKAEDENHVLQQAANLQLHYSLLNELHDLKIHVQTQDNLLDARNKEIKRLNRVIKKHVDNRINQV